MEKRGEMRIVDGGEKRERTKAEVKVEAKVEEGVKNLRGMFWHEERRGEGVRGEGQFVEVRGECVIRDEGNVCEAHPEGDKGEGENKG